jgi:hypothetical protein
MTAFPLGSGPDSASKLPDPADTASRSPASAGGLQAGALTPRDGAEREKRINDYSPAHNQASMRRIPDVR